MNVDRYATVEIKIHKEQPSALNLSELLGDWGLSASSQERLWVISYDGVAGIRTVVEAAVGGYHDLHIPIPAVLTSVLLAGADRFQIAHNHPSGDISPTMHDVDLVHSIMAAANATGLYFEDSLIVGPADDTVFSFLANGLIIPAPDLIARGEPTSGHARAPFVPPS